MKAIEDFGVRVPDLLLPSHAQLDSWAVIACDQYTQDRAYWQRVEAAVGQKPSTLRLILPEVYLSEPDKAERIQKIRGNMQEYLADGVFAPERTSLIYLERKTAFGRLRKGIVALIDLETYDWKPFSKANIRATEATITERIPPRMEIRRGAPLELPHIMLLANDRNHLLDGGVGNLAKKSAPVYDGTLMCNGGSVTGWACDSEAEAEFTRALNSIAAENTAADGSVFLFAVGDGNHSLATAKAVWEEVKKEQHVTDSPVRYALVEIVNIYDEGLTFEPIHRVVFDVDGEMLLSFLKKELGGTTSELDSAASLEAAVKKSSAGFGFVFKKGSEQKFVLLSTDVKGLAVSAFQPALDAFLKTEPHTLDYIHGADEVFRLGSQEHVTGILLPPVAKESFFDTINATGPLPRKSFSMGEADEKRFYLECRRLFA